MDLLGIIKVDSDVKNRLLKRLSAHSSEVKCGSMLAIWLRNVWHSFRAECTTVLWNLVYTENRLNCVN